MFLCIAEQTQFAAGLLARGCGRLFVHGVSFLCSGWGSGWKLPGQEFPFARRQCDIIQLRPGEWKGLSSPISSEIRQRTTFFAREGVRGRKRAGRRPFDGGSQGIGKWRQTRNCIQVSSRLHSRSEARRTIDRHEQSAARKANAFVAMNGGGDPPATTRKAAEEASTPTPSQWPPNATTSRASRRNSARTGPDPFAPCRAIETIGATREGYFGQVRHAFG